MEYTTLTGTGMEVSRLCLGTMGFSEDGEDWSLERDQAREIIDRAIELGITLFDTANTYHDGESEAILGDAIADYDRDRFVIATKCRWGSGSDLRNETGLSRKALDRQLANSLDRLKLDTIDLYQIHRWDQTTPIDVTLRSLNTAVENGAVRYLGASSMWTSQFVESIHICDRMDLEPFRTMQPYYNLVYRERERELLPYCNQHDIGVLPWSPLQHGYLARPDDDWLATDRGQGLTETSHPIRDGNNPEINRRVEELAADKGVSMAQIALAWLLEKEWVDAPIIGVSSVEHLEDAVAAVELSLPAEEMAYLEDPYEPVRIDGWDGARDRMGYDGD